MTRGEINKGPTTGNGVGASSLEIFELEIFPSRLHCGHVFEPKLNAQQGAICETFFFFFKSLSRAHRGVLVPTSLWLGPIDSLPFATVVFWLH